jgi:cytidylate kinase
MRRERSTVRLNEPPARRVEQAMRAEGIDRETARDRLRGSDRASDAYVRHVYGADPRDPRLCHLVVDCTALDLAACVDLLTLAAFARSESPAQG